MIQFCYYLFIKIYFFIFSIISETLNLFSLFYFWSKVSNKGFFNKFLHSLLYQYLPVQIAEYIDRLIEIFIQRKDYIMLIVLRKFLKKVVSLNKEKLIKY